MNICSIHGLCIMLCCFLFARLYRAGTRWSDICTRSNASCYNLQVKSNLKHSLILVTPFTLAFLNTHSFNSIFDNCIVYCCFVFFIPISPQLLSSHQISATFPSLLSKISIPPRPTQANPLSTDNWLLCYICFVVGVAPAPVEDAQTSVAHFVFHTLGYRWRVEWLVKLIIW